MVNILVITHGDFGAYLVEAAEGIVGPQGDGVQSVGISARVGLPEARSRIAHAVEELSSGNGLVVATDMPGGTPSNIAMPLARGDNKIAVVSGVNLYMLIAAFNNRTATDPERLAETMVAAGRRSISDIKSALAARA